MQKRLLLVLAVLLLAACSDMRFPGVYRIDIEQGNIVDEAMIGKLRIGMTETQVSFVMGSPQVNDPFDPGHWAYVYRLRKGNGEVTLNRIELFFTDGTLARWEGKPLSDAERSRFNTSTIDKKPLPAEPVDEPSAKGAAIPVAAEVEPAAEPAAAEDTTPH